METCKIKRSKLCTVKTYYNVINVFIKKKPHIEIIPYHLTSWSAVLRAFKVPLLRSTFKISSSGEYFTDKIDALKLFSASWRQSPFVWKCRGKIYSLGYYRLLTPRPTVYTSSNLLYWENVTCMSRPAIETCKTCKCGRITCSYPSNS